MSDPDDNKDIEDSAVEPEPEPEPEPEEVEAPDLVPLREGYTTNNTEN